MSLGVIENVYNFIYFFNKSINLYNELYAYN